MFTANWLFKRLILSVAQASRVGKRGWSVLLMFSQSNNQPLNTFLHSGLILPPGVLEKTSIREITALLSLITKSTEMKADISDLFDIAGVF